jgi:hypothetical protein
MSAIRIGWIGCGTHANEMLLPQLMRHDVRLTALCDTDADRLGRTAQRYGVAEADRTRDWQALLAPTSTPSASLQGPPPITRSAWRRWPGICPSSRRSRRRRRPPKRRNWPSPQGPPASR